MKKKRFVVLSIILHDIKKYIYTYKPITFYYE